MEGGSSSPTGGGDGGGWGSLPQPLVENILARLPLVALAYLRLVCKTWNSIILSDSFTELRTQIISPPETWFLISWKPQKSIVVYDPTSREWHEMPAHSLIAGDSQILATAGGLLFAVSYFKGSSGGTGSENLCCYEDFQFTVCNPLTGSWRKIACNTSVLDIYVVGMTYDPHTNSYLILLCGSCAKGSQYLATEVYESSSDCWRDGDEFVLPEPETQFESVQREAVWFQGLFFCLLNDTIHAYDLHKSRWSTAIARVPSTDAFISLLTCCNSLLMVTEIPPLQQHGGGEASHARLPFRAWELDQQACTGSQWVEKHLTAPDFATNLLDPGWNEDYYVFGEAGRLCLWTVEEDFQAYSYDCWKQRWDRVPRSHLLQGLDWLHNLCGMPFQPNFNANV